jgi:hypothetical protein
MEYPMLKITRAYHTAENAELAVKRLKLEGFTDNLITSSPPGAQERRWMVSICPPFGMGGVATEILDRFNPVGASVLHQRDPEPGLESISRLSAYKSPGAISSLSRSRSPGAISALSRSRSPVAISTLSRWKSPGAISRLSRPKSPGAISRLSKSSPPHAVSRLSAGWYFSNLIGLPLLTRSQAPIEPEASLLTNSDGVNRNGTWGSTRLQR